MLDIKFVRDNPELVLQNLKNRNNPMNLDRFMELEKQRREIIAETENLKSQKNAVSKKISEMKKNKEKLLLESRVTSVIRALAVAYIEENDEIDEEIVTKNVKNLILTKTKEYMSK